MSTDAWENVASLTEFGEADRLSVIIDDTPALLIRENDNILAVEDVCTHDGQPLTDGEIADGSIACPRHGAKFDLKTGAPLCMPATQPIQVFEVKVEGDNILARPKSETAEPETTASTGVDLPQIGGAASAASQSAGEASAASSETPDGPNVDAPGVGDMLDALKKVVDPELFINIVDLGLVYDISKKEENENDVVMTMTLTSPACPAGPQIVSEARQALESLPGVNSAEIKMTMSPPWTHEMMTDEARDQLGIF